MDTVCYFDWDKAVRVLSALLTPAIAVTTSWIAYQQLSLNRRQHRLALLERRMRVFDSTVGLIAAIVRDAQVELAQLFNFLRETREYEFLFGPEVGDYINELYKKGAELHAVGFGIRAGQQADIQRSTEILNWFVGKLKPLEKRFPSTSHSENHRMELCLNYVRSAQTDPHRPSPIKVRIRAKL